MSVLNASEFFILKWPISCYVNFTTIFRGKKKQKWIELKGNIKNFCIRNINKYAISIMHIKLR